MKHDEYPDCELTRRLMSRFAQSIIDSLSDTSKMLNESIERHKK